MEDRKLRRNEAKKTAFIVTGLLIATCSITSAMGMYSLATNLSRSIENELALYAKSNALQIQEIFNVTTTSIRNIQLYTNDLVSDHDFDVLTEHNTEISEIYGVEISEDFKEFENYVFHATRNTIKSSDDVMGMGMIFNQYALSENIREYSFYMTEDNYEETPKHFMDYEEFSKEEFYKEPKNSTTTYATSPYLDENGNTIISICERILKNDEFIGVMASDISLNRFNTLDLYTEYYTSMFSAIYDHNLDLAFYGENTDYIGNHISGYFVETTAYAEIEKLIKVKEPFSYEARDGDGVLITAYFYPISLGDYTWWGLTCVNSFEMYKSLISSLILLGATSFVAILCTSIILMKSLNKKID